MDFNEVKIEELIDEIAMGPFGSNIKKECFVETGVPVLNGGNLTGFTLVEDQFNYVTEEKANTLKKANAYRGDIVITHRGTLGQIVYIPEDSKYDRYVISQSQFRIKLNNKALPAYVVYFFHTRDGQHRLLSNKSQVGVPSLARPSTTFKTLKIPLPSLDIQKKIVNVLECIEQKIQLNNKLNANLLGVCKALYVDYFISCTPFENVVDTEYGIIPDGWRFGQLSELIEVKYGKDHKKLQDGNIPVYGSGGIMRYVDTSLYRGESVLIPRKGSLNNVLYVNEEFWSVDTMFYTIMRDINLAKYVYFFVSSKDLLSMNAGSAVPSMTTDILNKMIIKIPPADVLQSFEEKVSPIFNILKSNTVQNQKLSDMRDTLLPQLMSGAIDLSQVDLEL